MYTSLSVVKQVKTHIHVYICMEHPTTAMRTVL